MDPSGNGIDALVAALAGRLLARRERLVVAESCTGGWIAKACTDLAGSSRWFAGGAVVYSDELKQRMLGVSASSLQRHGAVSEAVVREMAAGALRHLGGEVSVAVSGIAGPEGGSDEKPVGTVWFAWAHSTAALPEVLALHRIFDGDRDAVRRAAVRVALQGFAEVAGGRTAD